MVKADRAQYGGCENCVTTLQHHNFPQLFSISPTTNNWTLDIFLLLFEPYHTCKSDRSSWEKNHWSYVSEYMSVQVLAFFIHSIVATHAAPPFWRLFDLTLRVMWSICFFQLLCLLWIVTFSLWESKSLNFGTDEISSLAKLQKLDAILFGLKNFQFLHAQSWPFTRVSVARVWRNFFLKIDFLAQHMGTSPQVKMASRYGLHPWLWLLL